MCFILKKDLNKHITYVAQYCQGFGDNKPSNQYLLVELPVADLAPVAVIINSTLLGRLSTKCVAVGI